MPIIPVIDEEKCNHCGLCVSSCTCGALQIIDDKIRVVKAEVHGWCNTCEVVCPTGAISCPFEIIIENPGE